MVACFYGFFVNGITALVLGSIMPSILQDFNLGYDKGGMLLSLYSTGNLIASFAGGHIALIAMIALGFSLMIIFKSPALLMLGFFLIGIGKGSNINMGNTNINNISHGDSSLLNILHTYFAVGAFMSPLLASLFFSLGYGWKTIVTVVIGFGLSMVILFSISGVESINFKRTPKEKMDIDFSFIRQRNFYLSAAMLFFYLGVEYAVNGWLVTYLKDSGMMDTSMAQRVLSIMWIVMIIGRISNVYIAKRFENKNIILFSSLGAIIFFILFMMSTNIWIIILWIFGLGLCLSGIYAAVLINTGGIIKDSKLAMSTLLGIAGLGGMTMPFIIGLVAEKVGIAGGMITIAFSAGMLLTLALVNKVWVEKYN